MKRISLILSFIILCVSASAGTPDGGDPAPGKVKVAEVEFSHSGPVFTIRYQLLFGSGVRSCSIEFLMSTDGGKSFETVKPSGYLTGDVGRVSAPGQKTIVFNASSDIGRIAGKPLAFKVNVTGKDAGGKVVTGKDASEKVAPENNLGIMIQASASVVPQLSYGLMFGMVFNRVGWYVKGLSDFSFPSFSYECGSDGTCSGGTWSGGTIETTGNMKKLRLLVTAGAMFRATGWLYLYVGAGYGSRGVYWEDTAGQWAKVSDYSFFGVAFDAGLAFKFGKFSFSVGIGNTMFKYTDVQVGLGVMF